jgi:putative redox protein
MGAHRGEAARMAVTIDIVYTGELHCRTTHGPSGRSFTTDAPTDNGGKGEDFSPTDLLATALGACLMTVMGIFARREGLDLEGTRVQVVKEMVSDPVRRIGALTATVRFPPGRQFSEHDRVCLERTAHTCPVRQSLHPDVKVAMTFEYPD